MTNVRAPGRRPTPPAAPRVPSVRELHGEHIADDYAWMRDPDQPLLREYLIAERAFYDAQSRDLDGLAARLAAEAAGRIPDGPEYSVGWPRGGFTYRTLIRQDSDNRSRS